MGRLTLGNMGFGFGLFLLIISLRSFGLLFLGFRNP